MKCRCNLTVHFEGFLGSPPQLRPLREERFRSRGVGDAKTLQDDAVRELMMQTCEYLDPHPR
jgi:hypothetical protein